MSSLASAPRRAAPGVPLTRLSRAFTIEASADLYGGLALAAALAAVAFVTTGGVDLAPNTWTEVVVVLAGFAAAIVVVGFGAPGTPHGLAPLAAFAGVALLTALSIAWSVVPSDSWVEANRTAAYFAAFATALALARLLPARWPAIVGGIATVATVLSAWALLVKVFPGTLAPQDTIGRVSAPFGYWNATGLIAALGLPAVLWAGSRRERGRATRALATPATSLLVTVIVLSYSRSAILAAVVAIGLWFALVPTRLRGALTLAVGGAGAALISGWALSTRSFTHDQTPLAQRTIAGHSLGVVLVLVLVVATVAGFVAAFAADRTSLHPALRHRIGVILVASTALIPFAGMGALATSSRGLTGEVSHIWTTLTSSTAAVGSNPGRLFDAANTRPLYWREGLRVGEHNLLAGAGAGGYATARHRYAPTDLARVAHAHSYVIQTFADLGLIGIALNVALLAAWTLAAATTTGWRRRSHKRGADTADDPERHAMVTLICAVVAFGISSTIDWTWFYPGVTVPALLAAGWLAGRGPLGAPIGLGAPVRSLTKRPNALFATATLTAAALLAGWTIWQPLHSATSDAAALTAVAHGDAAQAIADARSARASDPVAVEPLWTLAAIYDSLRDRRQARAELVAAVNLQPENPLTWRQLGLFDLRRVGARQALLDFQKARSLDATDLVTTTYLKKAGGG